jgi:hypothetical protein
MWRPMLKTDLDEVNQIAERMWGFEFYEAPAVFEEKLTLFPEGCFVYDVGQLQGYAFSHPWFKMKPPALNALLGSFIGADIYHIHDVSLLYKFTGQGAFKELMPKLEKIAQRYNGMSLVSVNKTTALWEKFNFVSVPDVDVTQYCNDEVNSAVYMLK